MIIVYKPTTAEGFRKLMAQQIGMVPIELDVRDMLERFLGDVALPTAEVYVPPPPCAPTTLTITFQPSEESK